MPQIPIRPVPIPIVLLLTSCATARWEAVNATIAEVAAPGSVRLTTPRCTGCAPPEEIGRALLVVMRRGSLRAAEEITGHKYETIGRWLVLAAEHAEALTEVLVHDLELSELEIDEFWSFVRRRIGSSPHRTHPSEEIDGAA